MRTLAAVLAALFLLAAAPPESHRNDFDYLLGDWEFDAVSKVYGPFSGLWSAVRLDGGQILDEFRILGDKGATAYLTTTLRNYDRARDRWVLVGLEQGNGLRDMGTAERVGAEMHLEQGDGPSQWRIRYYNITADRFSWAGDHSDDGGKTWVKNFLTIEARRVGPARSLGALTPSRH